MRIALAIPLLLLPAVAAAQIPVLTVTPRTLLFVIGGPQSPALPQQVHIDNRGSGTLTWKVAADVPWVRVSPAAGTGAGDVAVTIDASRLANGRHDATIRIEATDADDSPTTIAVTAQVGAASRDGAPAPSASKVQLKAVTGSATPATWAFQLDGPRGAAVRWRLTSDAPWLSADPLSGTTPTRVTIKASAAALAPGGYQGAVQFFDTAGEALMQVPIFFAVDLPAAAAGKTVTSTPAPKDAKAEPARPDAATAEPQPLSITADGMPPATRNLPYTQAIPIRGGKPPYQMRIVAGRLPVGLALSNGSVTGMTRFPGNYAFTIAVTDASTPPELVTRNLTLRVIILQTDTALTLDQSTITMSVFGAQRTQRARLTVGSGRQQLDFKATTDAEWLRLTPSSGMSPVSIQLDANAAGLAPGTYVATVTIDMPGAPNSPATVPVQLIVRK